MPKIFSSEHTYSYKNYTFGYALYAQRLDNENIETIYEQGFLPYTGEHKSEVPNLYYMARSARVNVNNFALSSENRRINKKFDSYNFSIKEYPAENFLKDKNMIHFCLEYFNKRHGPNTMNEERFKRILNYSKETKVIEYINNETKKPCAYVLEIQSKNIAHYWFSFYDLSLTYLSFGMWLMINRVVSAQQSNKLYYYLGTVYGDKALYKTNIPAMEYWNGSEWVNNINQLKKRARTDETRVVVQPDEFKESN